MSIKDFIQLVEQADIPNMQILGPLDDGFANIRYNGMAGVLDQQTNKMILISPKVPDSFHIVTVAGGRETTQYVSGSEIGPATKKALDSITPRQRPRSPAPLPVQESYESTEQVRSIVQRMMEDARVPQKPRQGPLRPQTGAGKHKDKKKDQKQGKAKHKGKELDEGRFDRGRDDQFSLGGRLERDNDFRNRERNAGVEHERNNYQVSINGKPWKVFADQRQAMNIARSLRMKGKEVEVYPTGANPSESVGEAAKKPNATTRHLRDYPVSDKDVAKPVKKPEKKKDDGRKQQFRGTGGLPPTDDDGNVLEQGVAEGSLETDNMVSHIGQVIQSIYPRGGDKKTYMKLVAQEMPRIVKANPKLFRRAFGMAYDRFFHIDQDDDFDYTDYSMRQGERGMAEEKQKGVDGKACWKGYKRMGTKKKGGRTVDNCVKMESISESILSSFGLMEKSPPGFKGTVKAMKKHPELTKGKTKDGKEKNPFALAWHMKNKGYKSHKKADGSDKD